MEGMIQATGLPRETFCTACYDGNYPVPFDPSFHKLIAEERRTRRFSLVDKLLEEQRQQDLL